MNNKSKRETAPEQKVQEQYVANISIDSAKLKKIDSLINQLREEIESFSDAIKVTYRNS